MSDVVCRDQWPETLECLSPRSLCRFRCVCTDWNSLITSSAFIARHLSAIAANPSRRRILLLDGKDRFSLLPMKNLCPDDAPQLLRFPFHIQERSSTVTYSTVGVVHGVIFLKSVPKSRLILWNPIIFKYVQIPSFHGGLGNPDLALGFDSSRNSFKIVAVFNKGKRWRASVFSTENGVWADVDTDAACGSHFFQVTGDLFLNGVIHWCNWGWNAFKSSVVFDCAADQFRTLGLPPMWADSPDDPYRHKFLSDFKGMLAVVDEPEFSNHDNVCHIWVMREYNVVESWANLFSIEFVSDMDSFFMARDVEEDEIVCGDDRQLTLYDTKTGSRKELGIETFGVFALPFEPSLMLLDVQGSRSYRDGQPITLA